MNQNPLTSVICVGKSDKFYQKVYIEKSKGKNSLWQKSFYTKPRLCWAKQQLTAGVKCVSGQEIKFHAIKSKRRHTQHCSRAQIKCFMSTVCSRRQLYNKTLMSAYSVTPTRHVSSVWHWTEWRVHDATLFYSAPGSINEWVNQVSWSNSLKNCVKSSRKENQKCLQAKLPARFSWIRI